MRELRFVVKNDRLSKDPTCDFAGIQRGSSGFLRCAFQFSAGWDGYRRLAVFASAGGEAAVEIVDGVAQMPAQVLEGRSVQVKVMGVKPGARFTTNAIFLRLEG